MVSERFLLPIVLNLILNDKEAKASQGDRPSPPKAESEDTISCSIFAIYIIIFHPEKERLP